MDRTRHGLKLSVDVRARSALRNLGVHIGDVQPTDKPLRWQIPFAFTGDRELAKYHVETFVRDEFSATNVQFFASVKHPTNCYCQFTPRGHEIG